MSKLYGLLLCVACVVAAAATRERVSLPYLGAAGWEISDGATIILIDPYISRINGPAPPGGGTGHTNAADDRRKYAWDDLATPDEAAIEAHIRRANFVLVTHTHYDHVLDVPHIALKTGATVIGTESTEDVMRAYSVPENRSSRCAEAKILNSASFP